MMARTMFMRERLSTPTRLGECAALQCGHGEASDCSLGGGVRGNVHAVGPEAGETFRGVGERCATAGDDLDTGGRLYDRHQ